MKNLASKYSILFHSPAEFERSLFFRRRREKEKKKKKKNRKRGASRGNRRGFEKADLNARHGTIHGGIET